MSTCPAVVLHDMISPGCCNYDEPMENASPPSVLGKRPRDETSEQTPTESSKLFQCGDCRKSYSRVDHLARHVRLHTKVSLVSSRVLKPTTRVVVECRD